MILSACQNTKYSNAVVQKAVTEAPTILPDWPTYCSDLMLGVKPKLNEPVWGTQSRWEIVTENENKRIQWCADHYKQIQDNAAHAVVTP